MVLIAMVAGGGCRESPTTGVAGAPAQLDIVDGDGQEGVVGAELPEPLVVKVVDDRGRPVGNQLVNFRVTAGGGSVFAGAALTNAQGIAQERWTLGTSTSGLQEVEARAVESETGNALIYGVFRATAKPGPAVALERVTTSSAEQVVGSVAIPPPAVRAIDQYGNLVPGVAITFTPSGGGMVTGGSVTTGPTGAAAVGAWTLATAAGVNTLTASAGALSPVSFTIAGVVGAAAQLVRHSADPQTAVVATTVPARPSVAVLDEFGNPVAGVAVTFTVAGGGGSLSGASQVSDAAGVATLGSWTVGTSAGTNTLEARAGDETVVFTTNATPGPPATITKLAGDNQSAEVGQPVLIAPRVRVADQYGNVVGGAELSFTIVAGAGTVTPSTVRTEADGTAAVTSWTLGTTAGSNTLSATSGAASPATFSATARAGQAVSLRVTSGPPSLAFPGGPFGVLVRMEDALGNPVAAAGVTVTAALASGPSGASLTGSSATTNSTGAATFSDLTILGADGTYSIRFSASETNSVTSSAITVMRFTGIVGGSWHTCALDTSGIAYCWGSNTFAQLGDGTINPANSGPHRLHPHAVSGGHRFTKLQSGANHTCGLVSGGAVHCWGNNGDGQLGNGNTAHAVSPVAVGGDLLFVDITLGGGHSCGLTAEGHAYCWGRNVYGQIGDGTVDARTLPTRVGGNLVFTSISAGSFHTCGVTADGTGYCWGAGNWGQLGAPTTEVCAESGSNVGCNRLPQAITGGLRFASISSGWLTTCGLDVAGDAYCWGSNWHGELGNGSPATTAVAWPTPTRVSTAERFVRIISGGDRGCGLTAQGSAFCWGSGGSVGDGTTITRLVPTALAGGHIFQTLELPATFLGASCGITASGTPVCWGGENRYAQVGDGTTVWRTSPTPLKPPE